MAVASSMVASSFSTVMLMAGTVALESGARLPLRRLRVPDLDVVEEAVLAGDAELDLGLGRVADAGGLEVAGGLAVDRRAHFIADGLDDEGVPFAGLELGGKGGAVRGEQL